MVIVRLNGGLGNQLFQYAAARRISIVNNLPLKLDISKYETCGLRSYRLGHFSVVGDFADTADKLAIGVLRRKSFKGLLRFAKDIFLPVSRKRFIRERQFHFDPALLEVAGSVYLDGDWQSERYFFDVADTLRKEFVVKTTPSALNRERADCIESSESVAVHFRRGDLVSNERTSQVHGVCSLDYYGQAIEQLIRFIPSPHFFVFSDDMDWAHNNFSVDFPVTFVDGNDADHDFEDIRLMSLCKHHVIANSTFSWWGAWLASNPGKQVFAPKKWFRDSPKITKDLIPGEWTLV